MIQSFKTAFGLVAGAIFGYWVSDKVLKSVDKGTFMQDIKETIKDAKDLVNQSGPNDADM